MALAQWYAKKNRMDVQGSVIAPPVPFPQPRLAFDIERGTAIRSTIEPSLREKASRAIIFQPLRASSRTERKGKRRIFKHPTPEPEISRWNKDSSRHIGRTSEFTLSYHRADRVFLRLSIKLQKWLDNVYASCKFPCHVNFHAARRVIANLQSSTTRGPIMQTRGRSP